MSETKSPYWPANLPKHLTLPDTSLFYNAEVAATRYPDKPYILFYDTPITFAEFKHEAERIAGYLQHECGVQAGDRVLLYMQNCPQWMIAYYGILRANAVVVPVNPMNMTEELRHYVKDSGAHVVFVTQELYGRISPLIGVHEGAGQKQDASRSDNNDEEPGLTHAIVATYSDYLKRPPCFDLPEFVAAPRMVEGPCVAHWGDVLAVAHVPGPLTVGANDPCVMPYTSGTTGYPKGCVHTHRNAMSTSVINACWLGATQDDVMLSVMPLFHVTGMQGGMNSPLYTGSTVVVLPRWDRNVAAQAIERHRINSAWLISTMVVDFLANPKLPEYDLSSLIWLGGGGAAMPDAVVKKLRDTTGLEYVEGYGMSETIAATHINPPQHPKPQCLGIPVFVDARVINPDTLEELPQGEVGEIIVNGPQVMREYWRNPEGTRNAFIERDGKRFLRTGDLGRIDEDGYFFMADRLKRMINASGYKVWPAEVETLMYRHPAIKEACVIGVDDVKRGETVKAFVVLDAQHVGTVTAESIIEWAHQNMAAYKVPRIIEFVDELPKSGSGKVQWRMLQEQEREKEQERTGARPA